MFYCGKIRKKKVVGIFHSFKTVALDSTINTFTTKQKRIENWSWIEAKKCPMSHISAKVNTEKEYEALYNEVII